MNSTLLPDTMKGFMEKLKASDFFQ